MTIQGWVLFGILALFILSFGIFGAIIFEKIVWKVLSVVAAMLLIIGLFAGMRWYYQNTASGQRAMTDQKSELDNGLERTVTIYTADGEIIADLMSRLRNAGTDHRKFMRMITVYVDLTAPLYWWKEFDTYKVGTVANSCSTMHKIAAKEFTLEDFSCEHLFDSANGEDTDCWTYSTEGICEIEPIDILNLTIAMLNKARELYLDYQQKASTGDQFAKDHVKEYWWQMIQLLPSSYNQRRTVMLNYEVLANIYKSRRNHKLDEWHTFCDWIEGLPYNELITGPSLKDIPISNEIMEEAKRRVHEELNAQFDHFCKLHEG